MLVFAGLAQAAELPTGAQVEAGSAAISQSGKVMTIHQASDRLVTNWQDFSIGQGSTVNFIQPSSSSVALNRVVGQDPSIIQGTLNANGHLFLVNPSGVLFAPGAQVNVGGLVASTLNLTTQNFLNGRYQFDGGSSNAIINQANIISTGGGAVSLIAARVINDGSISANHGSVLIGAGAKVTLDLGGPVKLQVTQGAIDALISNGGAIKADGGLIYLSAKAAGDLASTVINNTGLIEAQTISGGAAGSIYLMGGMERDRISVAGRLDASAPNGGDGGFIETSASRVKFAPDFTVSTASARGRSGHFLIDPHDYTIAPSGGDITGASLSSMLVGGDVTITVNPNTIGGFGDILINDNVTYANHTLTLNAYRDININAVITVTNGSLSLNSLMLGKVTVGKDASGFIGRVDFLETQGGLSLPRSGTGFLTVNNQSYNVINNINQLQSVDAWLSANTALGSHIDASSSIANNFNVLAGGLTLFTGVFEGLGHTINGLMIHAPAISNVGLFAQNSGTIQNLSFVGASVNGYRNVGVVAGTNNGLIRNVLSNQSFVTGIQNVGGLVGSNGGSMYMPTPYPNLPGCGSNCGRVENSYSVGNVSIVRSMMDQSYMSYRLENIGGLVGYNASYATVANSHSGGSLSIENAVANSSGYGDAQVVNVGGLIGYNNDYAIITDSFSTTSLSILSSANSSSASANAYVSNVGGLIGYNSSSLSLTNVYATGAISVETDVTGANGAYTNIGSVGGLIGYNRSAGISNAYATGSVSVTASGISSNLNNMMYGMGVNSYSNNIGGLIGLNERAASIVDSYATGHVSSTSRSVNTADNLLNGNYGMNNSYSYSSNVGGLIGSIGSMGSDSSLTISRTFATGDVSSQSSAYGLVYVNSRSDSVGGLIGYARGVMLEHSHAVGNVTSLSRSGPPVNSVAVPSSPSQVYSANSKVGGLVGMNEGYMSMSLITPLGIRASYSTGTVQASSFASGHSSSESQNTYIGGLVGLNGSYMGYGSNMELSGSFSSGAVTSHTEAFGNVSVLSYSSHVGGMVGLNGADNNYMPGPNSYYNGYVNILNSYASGDVTISGRTGDTTSISKVGGLVGANGVNGNIYNSYYSGTVSVDRASGNVGALVGYNLGSVERSFWDAGRAGVMTSQGGVGLSTSQIMQQSSYSLSAWDFSGTWTMYEGLTSPLLRSFMTPILARASDTVTTYTGLPYVNQFGVTYYRTDLSPFTPVPALILGSPRFITNGQLLVNAGSYSIYVDGLYSSQLGYILVNDARAGTLTINKAPLTVTADSKARTYGETNPTLTQAITGFVNGEGLGVVSGSASPVTLATRSSGVGSYTISASVDGLSASNYEFSNLVNGVLAVNRASLTVTANNQSRMVNAANPQFTQTVRGFVNGDTQSVLVGSAFGVSSANILSSAGSYVILASAAGLSAANYEFNYLVNGSLTITNPPASLVNAVVSTQATVTASNSVGLASSHQPKVSTVILTQGPANFGMGLIQITSGGINYSKE